MPSNVITRRIGPSRADADRRSSMRAAITAALSTAGAFVSIASAQTCDGWQLVSENGPLPRYHHGMAYDTGRGVCVVFGGLDSSGGGISDTWEWDGSDWALVSQNGPGARYMHAMAYDSARGVTVLYGCYSRCADTWEWDGIAWTRVAETGPGVRYSHAMAYDSAREVTVLFGGQGDRQVYGDTWEWDGTAWTQVAQSGPSARAYAAMAYDSARGVMVLFGGAEGSSLDRGDTWEWNGVEWTQVLQSGPSPRRHHSMAYDQARGVMVLHGGQTNTGRAEVFGDTWQWDGFEWTLVSHAHPGIRYGATMSYDLAQEAPILFGGRYHNPYGDTWEFVEGGGAFYLAPVVADCPGGGRAAVSWGCGTPGGRVALLFARFTGTAMVPRGSCAGTTLGLGETWLQFVRAGRSDKAGSGKMIATHGPLACGGYVQLIDLSTCATSFVAPVD